MDPLKQLPSSKSAPELSEPPQTFVPEKVNFRDRMLSKIQIFILQMSMSKEKFHVWYEQTRLLKNMRVEVMQSLPQAASIAKQLDEGSYDRQHKLLWNNNSKDPLTQHLQPMITLKKSCAAKPFNTTEAALQKLRGNSFEHTSQQDISSYIKAVIPHTHTPEGLVHIYRIAMDMQKEKQISKSQFHHLHIAIQQQVELQLPALCQSLQQLDNVEADPEQVTQLMYACYDLAVAINTCAPRLLQHPMRGCTPPQLGAWLQQIATKAYRQSVNQLPAWTTSKEAKETLDNSLMLLHDVLKPTLAITTDSQKQTGQIVMYIQKETNYIHYELVKPQHTKNEVLSHHEALENKQQHLQKNLKELYVGLEQLKKFRNDLRTKCAELANKLKNPINKNRKEDFESAIASIKKRLPRANENILAQQKKIIFINAKSNETHFRELKSNTDKQHYTYKTALESRKELGTFYLSNKLSKEHIQLFQSIIQHVEQELNWSSEDVDLLFTEYTQWLKMEYIEPHAALHYLNQVIEQHQDDLANDEMFDLDETLFDITDHVQSYNAKFRDLAATLQLTQAGEVTEATNALYVKYQNLVRNEVINYDNVQILNTFFDQLIQQQQLSQEQIRILVEYYEKWIIQYGSTSDEALQYIDKAVLLMQQKSTLTLHDSLNQVQYELREELTKRDPP